MIMTVVCTAGAMKLVAGRRETGAKAGTEWVISCLTSAPKNAL
jgi:hypothetical protein